MKTSIRSIHAMRGNLLITIVAACLVGVALMFAAIPARAGEAEDKAKKAFADWKAANQTVAAAKEKLAEANKVLQNAMTAVAKSGGKTTPEQEAALAKGRADVAAAEAALKDAEARLFAARVAFENAIAELPDGKLKDQLKRERNFPSLVTANGLHTVVFELIYGPVTQGRVIVHLPDDIRAGDTISGTVVAEPNGNTKEERERNLKELQALVFEIKDFSFGVENPTTIGSPSPVISRIPVATDKPFTLKVPALTSVGSSSSPSLGITLNNTGGSLTISGTVPAGPKPNTSQPLHPPTANDFRLPTIGQQGRPVEIRGPFDGNFSNTALNRSVTQDFEKNTENVSSGFGLIAESPRKAVFRSPSNVTGPVEINLKEGNVETRGTYRNVKVQLSAPKTNLRKGESTTLTVRVEGLQGIKQDVPFRLEKSGVVTMQGGDMQARSIKPNEVQADGSFTMTRTMTGMQAGAFSVAATVRTDGHNWEHEYSWLANFPPPQPPGGGHGDDVPVDMKGLTRDDLRNPETVSLGRLKTTLRELEARIEYSDEKSGPDSEGSKQLRKWKTWVEKEIEIRERPR